MELFIIMGVLSAVICAAIAGSKGLNVLAWGAGGLIFGILAVIAVAFAKGDGR